MNSVGRLHTDSEYFVVQSAEKIVVQSQSVAVEFRY